MYVYMFDLMQQRKNASSFISLRKSEDVQQVHQARTGTIYWPEVVLMEELQPKSHNLQHGNEENIRQTAAAD